MNDTLLDVVDRLTIEHPYPALIEGRRRWVRRDPLIQILRDSITSSLVGGSGPGGDTASIPFDSDALEQYNQLEGLILERFRAVTDAVPHLTPEQNLRAWYTAFAADMSEEGEAMWRRVWASWESKITSKLTPPVVLELIDLKTRKPFDCPECGGPTDPRSKIPAGWFEVVLNSGPDGRGGRWYEKEQRVKLTAMYRPDGNGSLEAAAVECGCCGWRVTGSAGVRGFAWHLEELANNIKPAQLTG